MAEKKPDKNRGYIGFAVAIILGYLLGFLIKKVQVGLIIGLAIGLLSSGLLRRRR